MCLHMPVPESDQGTDDDPEALTKRVRNVTRRLVLSACQRQFQERPGWAHLSKGSISEEQFEEVVKIKSKVLGNMRFVAELFNYSVITIKAMNMILSELLKDTETPKEEDLECVLMLLTTAGFGILNQSRTDLDNYVGRIRTIVDDVDLIPRIKFALLDLVSLREAGFQKTKGPRPSAANAAAAASSVSRGGGGSRRGTDRNNPDPRGSGRGTDRRGDRGQAGSGGPSDWNTTGGRRTGGGGGDRRSTATPTPGGGYSRPDDHGGRATPSGRQDARFGPQSGIGGGGGGRGGPATPGRSGLTSTKNAFSVLQKDHPSSEEDEEDDERMMQAAAELERASASPASDGPRRTSDSRGGRSVSPAASKRAAGAKSPVTPTTTKATPAVAAPPPGPKNEAEAYSKIERLMTDLGSDLDFASFGDDLKIFPVDLLPYAIGQAYGIATNGSEKAVKLLVKGLVHALSSGVVPESAVINGLVESTMLDEFEDMLMDVPRLPEYTRLLADELEAVTSADSVAAIRGTIVEPPKKK
ncbi:hypothetical protein BC828DRAFT_386003 [Blastocladiella britannica]|nr:hypothetical protein BC828DRAFT_386003 [Blastocladiella britannica]